MTDLHAVAMASGEDIETIRDLNNELLKNLTPPGKNSYELRIPAGTYERVASNLARLQPVASIDYKTHVVKKGDTLTAICRTYNLSKTALLKANNLHTAKLVAGQRLRIPYQTTKYVLLKEGEKPAKIAARVAAGSSRANCSRLGAFTWLGPERPWSWQLPRKCREQ